MREYSSPAVAEISPAATLADVVFERAEREPQRGGDPAQGRDGQRAPGGT